MKTGTCTVFLIFLNFVSFFCDTQSFIIPYLIYDAVKNGWFRETFVGTTPTPSTFKYDSIKTSVRPVVRISDVYPRLTTTTTTTTTNAPLSSVEYLGIHDYNPCGYGPLPAFDPRDEWHKKRSEYIPNVPEEERYTYTLKDVDNTTDLGSFLLSSLKDMKEPNFYSRKAFFNSWVPKYNHYKIHKYNFNAEKIPRSATIEAVHIINCTADSASLCPNSTMSLCTSNGAIICITKYSSTETCRYHEDTQYCVVINVANQYNPNQMTKEKVPCFSNVKVLGHIDFHKINSSTTIIPKEEEKDKPKQMEKMDFTIDIKKIRERFEREKDPFQKMIDDMNKKLKEVENFRISDLLPETIHSDSNPASSFCVSIVALPGWKIK